MTRRLETLMPLVAHIQVADAPGRNEPGSGEIGWEFVFARIAGSATAAGSAASTGRRPTPRRASPGAPATA